MSPSVEAVRAWQARWGVDGLRVVSTRETIDADAERRIRDFLSGIMGHFCADLRLDLMLFGQKAARAGMVTNPKQISWVGFATDMEGTGNDGRGGTRIINPVVTIDDEGKCKPGTYVLVGEGENRTAQELTSVPQSRHSVCTLEVGGLVEYMTNKAGGWLHTFYSGNNGNQIVMIGGEEKCGVSPYDQISFEKAVFEFLGQDRENVGMRQVLTQNDEGISRIAKIRGKRWARGLEAGGMERRQTISNL